MRTFSVGAACRLPRRRWLSVRPLRLFADNAAFSVGSAAPDVPGEFAAPGDVGTAPASGSRRSSGSRCSSRTYNRRLRRPTGVRSIFPAPAEPSMPMRFSVRSSTWMTSSSSGRMRRLWCRRFPTATALSRMSRRSLRAPTVGPDSGCDVFPQSCPMAGGADRPRQRHLHIPDELTQVDLSSWMVILPLRRWQ